MELRDSQIKDNYRYVLVSPNGNTLEEGDSAGELILNVFNPSLWNAEQPNLYRLYIHVGDEWYLQEIGLRRHEIIGTQYYVNGQSIKFSGVNHHDTHPEKASAVNIEDHLIDLKLMKEYNFNAVRTAHYPKTAEFYELTDRLGFYVMSEADIECHGVVDLIGLGGYGNYNMMMNDPVYEEAFVERMIASMVPFMNYSSIVMWSGGNECGYGYNFEKTGEVARQIDPIRPLHYEGWWHRDRERDNDSQYVDVISRMYASIEEMDELYFNPENPIDRPFMLCEYIHAMGNGPGDILAYYESMLALDEFIGGFVWEWADYAANIAESENDEPLYCYGGDFKDFPHFDNFCMDGLVYPDRTLHTGLLDYQQIFRPVRITNVNKDVGLITLRNQYDFTSLNDNITLELEVYNKRLETNIDDLYEPYVKPQENGSHNESKELQLTNELNLKLNFQSNDSFSFNLSHFSTQQLTDTRLRDELIKEDSVYLHIDTQQSGVGSAACGPELAEIYRLNDNHFALNFSLNIK